MARVTADEVRTIMGITSSDQGDDIVNAMISGANSLVTEALGSDTTITDTLKKEIERWVAAHMLASTQERVAEEVGGGPAPKVKFTGKYGMYLSSTPYGQMALALDTTGKLASLTANKRASLVAITSFD